MGFSLAPWSADVTASRDAMRTRDFGDNRQITTIVVARAGEQLEKHFAATIPDFEVAPLEPHEAPTFAFDDLNDSTIYAQAHGVRVAAIAFAAFVGNRDLEFAPLTDRAFSRYCRRGPVA